ncbi:MAG: hypothetical protein FRX48_08577 [Lasallia pustulata]|uniref:N-acetyltransferase domain-containing protein n=1 Tax=Lasallia pustulata TaxID=136370 RepID=A0A5M8PEG2_9LECA|nr:MAG: hypothetical protein FRX48_08577 [Lasallia pustulata]
MEKPSPTVTVKAVPTSMSTHVSQYNTTDDQVRVLRTDEYKGAAQCLAEAFAHDGVVKYCIDTPDRDHWTASQRWDLHVTMLEYITYAHCMAGLATAVGPDYGCVALWMPPGKDVDDWCTYLRSGMWRLNYQLSAEGRTRFFNEFLPILHSTKHEVMGDRDNDSWYLVYIGTKPNARGKGYATKSIRYITDKADAEARACYLESSNPINLVIYERLGFGIKKKIHLLRGRMLQELDIMVREPVSAAGKIGAKLKETRMDV